MFFNLFLVISSLYSLSAVEGNGFKIGNYYRHLTPRLRIIGGEEAVPHAYPYQVGLLIDDQSLCGASLISPHYVLTAAHCAKEIYNSVIVILGAHNITSDEPTQVHIKGSRVIIHENYNYTSFQNDIALIRLARPAPLNDVIKTIALPSRCDSAEDYFDSETTSTGWGLTQDNDSPTLNDISSVLRVVNVTVMDLEECAEDYNDEERGVTYVSEMNLCTSGLKNKGTCNGDSGGPLVYRDRQIGIVSIGSTICEMCAPSVFTKVDQFLDWIEEHSDVVIS